MIYQLDYYNVKLCLLLITIVPFEHILNLLIDLLDHLDQNHKTDILVLNDHPIAVLAEHTANLAVLEDDRLGHQEPQLPAIILRF